MDKTAFVYVTYIVTTPERLWSALTDPEISKQYWGGQRVEAEWKPGGRMVHRDDVTGEERVRGTVDEYDPPHRLVCTWEPADSGPRASEPATRVTFDVKPLGEEVMLQVTHDNLVSGGETYRAISGGWPAIISNLKTYLETGRTLATVAQFAAAQRNR